MDEVVIICNEVEHRFDKEDVTPEILKECFGLNEEPKILLQESNSSVIYFKKWQSKLTPGFTYHIKSKDDGQSSSEHKQDDTIGELVLNALIASTAVYYISHELDDEEKCKKYLMEQLTNHNFEDVILSQNGESYYLIAKEADTNRIYIAFRGSKELSDWKYNLQVRFFPFGINTMYSIPFVCLVSLELKFNMYTFDYSVFSGKF